ncbi:MAG: PEGA domain-containing protein [Prevotella sp.]|nr:PEGA domain-containing protein [Prevotella sp.]
MKRIVFSFLLLALFLTGYAQQLNVKSVSLRHNDARARTNPRDDAKGNKCAIIRVGIVGVDDLEFPDAVGDVEHSMSEYIVYVPSGLKKLKYKNKTGQYQGSIDFDDYGLEVNPLTSYDVIFETDNHLRAAIFSIIPANAKLTFNYQKVKVDKDGIAIVNVPPGNYSFSVEADGYQTFTDMVSLTEDDISTTTSVNLEQKKHRLTIEVYPFDAGVFIDNEPSSAGMVELSEGKHTIRVTAPKFEDKERTIMVDHDMKESFSLEEVKPEVVKHKEERTRTSISVRGANYLNVGFAMLGIPSIDELSKKENAWDFNLEYTRVYHFAGIMGVRFGLGGGLIKSNKNEKYIEIAYDMEIDSLLWIFHVDIPLQLGVSLPFGKYNQHMLNVYGGGYGRYLSNVGIREDYLAPDDDLVKNFKEDDKKEAGYDYGIRVNASIDIGHFTVGAELNQSLNDFGFSAGVNIGWKIYRKKKD